MQLQVTILVLVALTQCQAYFPGGYGSSSSGYTPRRSRCYSSAMPCRLKFELIGSVPQTSSTHQCSCNSNLGRCSNDWTSSNSKVISRNLRSLTMNVTLSMMFCQSVTPADVCAPNQLALEVSGFLLIPNELEHYHCRCNDNSPLYLKERLRTGNRFWHKYICSSDWHTCASSRTSPCMTVRNDGTTYHCKCPSNQVCRTNGTGSTTVEENGYCFDRTL